MTDREPRYAITLISGIAAATVICASGLFFYNGLSNQIDIARFEWQQAEAEIVSRLSERDPHVRATRTLQWGSPELLNTVSVNMFPGDSVENWAVWSADLLSRVAVQEPMKAKR